MGKRPGVMIYYEMRPSRKLSDAERLRLYDAMMDFGEFGTVPELDGAVGIVWDYLQSILERSDRKYTETCEKRAQAGSLGGQAAAEQARRREMSKNVDKTVMEEPDDPGEASAVNTANAALLPNRTEPSTTEPNKTEQNRAEERPADKPPARPRFVPPTKEAVCAYARTQGYSLDPSGFWDYYTACGWKIGKNPMRDWQAALRNWGRKEQQYARNSGSRTVSGAAPADDPVQYGVVL